MNRLARRQGAAADMTVLRPSPWLGKVEACACCHALLKARPRHAAAMLECVATFSPRIEEASQGRQLVPLCWILAGTERLFGPPRALAERLRTALSAAGFRTSIAVSANFHAARIMAAASRGITVIPAGEEESALAKLPLALLETSITPGRNPRHLGHSHAGRAGGIASGRPGRATGPERINPGAIWPSARTRIPFNRSRLHFRCASSASSKRPSSRWTRCCLWARA